MRALVLCLLVGLAAHAQILLNPGRLSPRLRDMASNWNEVPLDCTVIPIRPAMNFSFRIQAGYTLRVPMNQFQGSGHGWVAVTRITPLEGDRKPVYLGARTPLPDVPKTKLEAEIVGGYLLGEGKYDVQWMMLDDQDRACHKEWTIEARLTPAERRVSVAIPPNTVRPFSLRVSPTAARDDSPPMRVSILMHAAPISPRRTRLRASDQLTLISSLSALMERLPASSVRMVMFNLDQQKELYRRENFTVDGIQQVWRALNSLELNLVEYKTLLNRKGHIDMLAGLLNQEVHAEKPADAVLILGPVTRFVDKPANGVLERPTGVPRFFFFEFKPLYQMSASLPDTLAVATNRMKGKVLVIRTPADFAKAIALLEKR